MQSHSLPLLSSEIYIHLTAITPAFCNFCSSWITRSMWELDIIFHNFDIVTKTGTDLSVGGDTALNEITEICDRSTLHYKFIADVWYGHESWWVQWFTFQDSTISTGNQKKGFHCGNHGRLVLQWDNFLSLHLVYDKDLQSLWIAGPS